MSKQFVIYKSSAGSGKTFTLAIEYLKLALAQDSPSTYKQILAITFTNKAAQEMKERVVKYLSMLAGLDPEDKAVATVKNILCADLKLSALVLKQRALNTLSNILHHYSDFNITTIDKFIVRIVRSFNMELKLPFNFEIEMDIAGVKKEALDALIAKVGMENTSENKALTQYVYRYLQEIIQGDDNWRFEETLMSLYQKLEEEEGKNYLAELATISLEDLAQSRKMITERIKWYEKIAKEQVKEIHENFVALNLDVKSLVGGKNGVYGVLDRMILSPDFIYQNALNLGKNAQKALDVDVNWDKSAGGVLDVILAPVLAKYRAFDVFKQQHLPRVNVLKEIHKNFFSFTLLSLFHQEIQSYKAQKNILFLSEFNDKINDFVLQQPVPFIYEKIGERFKNYLIDEFQDTSESQWQNLLPLVDNALAYNEKNILVGDVKQAIYRWRGGNVDQFNQLPQNSKPTTDPIINERYESLQRHFNESITPLTKNWRSLPNVVKFNNAFLSYYLRCKPTELNQYYTDYIQEFDTTKEGGWVEMMILDKNEEDVELKHTLNIIEDVLNRGYQYKDIGILTRNNKDNTTIAEYLTKHQIDINSDESLHLAQSDHVVFVMYIYQLLFDPHNKKALVNATEYLLKHKATRSFKHHQEILQQSTNYTAFEVYLLNTLGITLPEINTLSTYEIIEEIIGLFKLPTHDPFVQTLLNILIKKNTESPIDVLTWWEEKSAKTFISTPENFNAVNILTIHKSKGLEYPILILPYPDKICKVDFSKISIWIDTTDLAIGVNKAVINLSSAIISDVEMSLLNPDLYCVPEAKEEVIKAELDGINLLYVALTRAGEELYILTKQQGKDAKNKFFQDYITLNASMEDLAYQLTENSLSFGTKKEFTQKKELTVPASQNYQSVYNSSWKDKIKISYTAPQEWNVPVDNTTVFDQANSRKYGNLIHLIFAKIGKHFQYQKVLEEMLYQGVLDEAIYPEIEAIFACVVQNSAFQQLWNGTEHWVERPLLTDEKAIIRPDRVIFHEDKAVVLDFKTGEQSKKDVLQIQEYKKNLNALLNLPVDAYLYYTNEDTLLKV